MNPSSDDYYTSTPGYDPTFFDQIMRAAGSYHTTINFKTDDETMETLLGKANAKQPAPTPGPSDPDPEPYDNAQIIREIDYSNFTEEELNQAIDHLHEVLLHKRGESLLDLDPNLDQDQDV